MYIENRLHYTKIHEMKDGGRGLRSSTCSHNFWIDPSFQTPSNFELDEHYIYPENLGFYACSSIQTKSYFDFAIFKLCPGQLDYSNQNGQPKKKQLEQRKLNSPSRFCFICTILLSGMCT